MDGAALRPNGPHLRGLRARGNIPRMMDMEPLKHLRADCKFMLAGDVVFIPNKTYTAGEKGENYTQCPYCWPKTEAPVVVPLLNNPME